MLNSLIFGQVQERVVMANLKALIFDVDGTLANTERDGHRVAFNKAFVNKGLDWDWSVELYGKLLAVTGGKERIRYYLQHHNTAFKLPANGDEFITELHLAKNKIYAEMLKIGAIPLRPGVERLLREARQEGVRLAIATTTSPENVDALLRYAMAPEVTAWFEVIGAGDIVPAKKPAPDIYVHVLKELNLPASACMALEDSRNGVRSSVDADLKTVITVNGYTEHEDFASAVLVVDSFGEPQHAMRVLQGNAHGHQYVDLALLKKLHSS